MSIDFRWRIEFILEVLLMLMDVRFAELLTVRLRKMWMFYIII